jgi:endonuclease/exonuclease/phosphatase family metal-dependent hydrolase
MIALNVLNSFGLILAYIGTHVSPNTWTFPAFFGLSYEIWLMIAIAFMVFWIFVKRWMILISLTTILIGFNHLRHYVAITLWDTQISEPVKIMSYNVHIFDFFDTDKRMDNRTSIFTFLEKEDPGIVCFQEFFQHEGARDFVTRDTILKILDAPYYHERYTHDMAFQRYFGTITISKYPIVDMGEIPFDNDPNNFCIYTDIDIDGKIVRVFNAHMGSIRFQNPDYGFFGGEGDGKYVDRGDEQQIYDRLEQAFKKRAIQAERVAEEIANSPHPVIFCSDLNDTPVSYSYRQFSRLLDDAFVNSGNGLGTTYIGEMPSNRIDYIFHSPELISSEFMTHPVDFSDHHPISCLIGFEEK